MTQEKNLVVGMKVKIPTSKSFGTEFTYGDFQRHLKDSAVDYLTVVSVSHYVACRIHTRAYGNQVWYFSPSDLEPYEEPFVLPEKWCIKITEDNLGIVGSYYNRKGATAYTHRYQIGFYYVSHNLSSNISVMSEHEDFGANFIRSQKPDGFIEISFEQFQKYVLKPEQQTTEQDMETKEIIAYKLIKPQYHKAVKTMTGFDDFDFITGKGSLGGYLVTPPEKGGRKGTLCYEVLKDAGVLDLWFEKVYKEEEKYECGDFVYVKGSGTGNGICDDFAVVKLVDKSKIKLGGNLNPDFGFYYGSGVFGIRKEFILRKATPEEIEAVQTRVITLSSSNKGNFEIVVKKGVAAYLPEDKILPKAWIEEILKQFGKKDSGSCYSIEVNKVDVGCMKNTEHSDWKKVLEAIEETEELQESSEALSA